jgi:hypothetical protein
MVTVPISGGEKVAYHRSGREPMCILSIEKPMVNMTINANPLSLAVLKNTFVSVNRSLENGMSWKEICGGRDGGPPFRQFLKDHKSFVKVEINHWGSSCMKGRALVGWLESRFVNVSLRHYLLLSERVLKIYFCSCSSNFTLMFLLFTFVYGPSGSRTET